MSVFITFSQELPESLLVDINRNPKQRVSAATKKALAVRGKAPEGIEVIAEAAPNPAHGWIKVHSEEMELMWGMTSCYVFKKYGCPYCNPGEVCMAVLPEESGDSTAYLAKYVDSTNAIFMDGTTEEPCEVGKMDALTAEARAMMTKRHAEVKASAKEAEAADAKVQVAAAVEYLKSTLGLASEAGLIGYAAEGTANKESDCLVQSLVKNLPVAGPPGRTASYVLSHWDVACREKDAEAHGGITEEQAQEIWAKLKGDVTKAVQEITF